MPSPRNSLRGGSNTAERLYSSPSLEVIGQLELANTLTQLDARLDSIELDIARLATGREEDSRRTSGEMDVMKIRVEDALNAVTETAQDLRNAWTSIDLKIVELMDVRIREQQRVIDAVRAQLNSGLEATRIAIDATEARLVGEVEALSGANTEQVRGISEIVEEARNRIDELVSEVEGRVVDVMAGSQVSAGALGEQIDTLSTTLRDEMAINEKVFAERIVDIADRVGRITNSFETVSGKLASTEARIAGDRAAAEGNVSMLTQQVRSLETRVAELSERIASTTTQRIEAMSGQVAEVREAILRVAERVGSTAFLTRRVADLEIRLAEVHAKVDRPDSF